MSGDPVLALQTRIKSLTGVSALVGARVYRIGSVPATPTLPYLLLPGTISDIGDACTSSSDNGHARVQVSVLAASDVSAEAISQALKKEVPCGLLLLQSGTDYLRVTSIEDAGAVPDMNTEAKVYIRNRDFRIAYAY